MKSPLSLSAVSEQSEYPIGSVIAYTVRLHNVSDAPVWVNRRMGVGYEDGFERELYFEVFDESGTLVPAPENARVDVHRMPPTRDDFTQLDPGGMAEATVQVSFWQPFKASGAFQIVFTYENLQDGSEFGMRAFTGIVSAPPVFLKIV
jgi:hypothetical protein